MSTGFHSQRQPQHVTTCRSSAYSTVNHSFRVWLMWTHTASWIFPGDVIRFSGWTRVLQMLPPSTTSPGLFFKCFSSITSTCSVWFHNSLIHCSRTTFIWSTSFLKVNTCTFTSIYVSNFSSLDLRCSQCSGSATGYENIWYCHWNAFCFGTDKLNHLAFI